MTSELDPDVSRRLSQFVCISSVLAMAFGLWVLMGWVLHVQVMTTILPGQVTVKANAAAGFILLGFALWTLRKEPGTVVPGWKLAAKVGGGLAGMLGLLSLLEFLWGWDFGIDQLLFRPTAEDIAGGLHAGLMSPVAAWGLLSLAPALLLLDARSRAGRWAAQLLPCGVVTTSLFGILDFVLDPKKTHTYISPLTASVLFFLSFAVLFARTRWGFGALIASAASGGTLTRRLLPAAIVTPLMVGWLRWRGEMAGMFSEWAGLTIMTVFTIVLLAGLAAWTGFTVNRSERERRRGQESIEELASIVTSSTDAIFSKTMDGVVTSWNPGAEAIYGYSAEEMIGQSISICIPRDRRQEFAGIMEKVGRGERVEQYETTRLRKDGRTIHVSVAISPVRDRAGRVAGASAIARDITERKRAEAALQESEAKFRALSDLVPQLVWMCTSDGLNVYFNQRWVEYTGLSLEESYGRGWNTPFHPDDKQAAWDAWNHAVATGETYRVESRLRAADGSYRWFLMRGVPLRDVSGSIVKWFGTCTDIDELKRAEQEIRKLNQELDERVQQRTAQLRESEQRVRRKLESILSPQGDLANLKLADLLDVPAVQSLADDIYKMAQIPMFILDLKGSVLVSVGWQEVCTKFHRAHPEASRNCEESDRVLSAGVAPGEFKLYKCKNNLWDVVTPIMLGEQQVGNLFSGQFFFADEAVDHTLFRSQARRFGFDEQEYLASLARVPRLSREEVKTSMRFYTKLAQLLSQLSYSGIQLARSIAQTGRANAELAASVKELEAFTYSVSHDLRAPLRHISGFSKILSEEFGAHLPDDARRHLQRIQDGTRRMGQLVDDLLNLARVGRRDLSLRVSGLKSIVHEAIVELAPEYANRQIEWKIGDLPFVQCDPGLMKQVFQNLISNAIKFTRPRNEAVIEIGQKGEDGTPVVFVRDNGVGFNMKYADKLFGVFQRLHRAEDFEGTGVGLATVQRIIQKHGGRIWAEAELDQGATFYFTLGVSESSELNAKAAIAGEQQ